MNEQRGCLDGVGKGFDIDPRITELLAQIEQLRTHLIQWNNGYVRCLVCGYQAHGGEEIVHEYGCIMDGYTKKTHSGPAVLFVPKGNSDE